MKLVSKRPRDTRNERARKQKIRSTAGKPAVDYHVQAAFAAFNEA